MIFNIQRFSTHDGPGVRTVVFMKGCPLRCPWCENPESQEFGLELFYDSRLCIGCLDCLKAAGPGEVTVRELPRGEAGCRPAFNRKRIRDASKFRGVCPTGALTVMGEDMELEEVARLVELDRPFYGRGGGVTFSGGEPFAQPELLLSLMERLSMRGVDIVVETSLQVAWAAVRPSLPLVSCYLADLKHIDAAKYRSATGGNLSVVLANLRNLEASGAPVVVRVPIVPGFNDTEEEVAAITAFAASLTNVTELHFLPYHSLGSGKYDGLGRDYALAGEKAVPEERLERDAAAAERRGLRVTIGG